MKKLFIIALLFSATASAQVDTSKAWFGTISSMGGTFTMPGSNLSVGRLFYTPSRIISTYDTTVLNKGKDSCIHAFVSERQTFSMISCAVYHGDTGCPDNWLNIKSICEHCLRHIHVKETRRAEAIPDRYSELLKKIQ